MSVIIAARDATASNASAIPDGIQAEGYSTGPGIEWTTAEWAAHKKPYPAVRICQNDGLTDDTADVADVESGAGTVDQVTDWAKKALVSYHMSHRPGQRRPAIYTSTDNVTPVVNKLIAGGVTSGIGLLVANWSDSQAEAIAKVSAGSGPFPVIGLQFKSLPDYDLDILSVAWLTNVSWVPKKPTLEPQLELGDTGPAVKLLQTLLNDHHLDPSLHVDGSFGPETRAAVVKFQNEEHLTVDGIVGPRTWAALGNYS